MRPKLLFLLLLLGWEICWDVPWASNSIKLPNFCVVFSVFGFSWLAWTELIRSEGELSTKRLSLLAKDTCLLSKN